MTDHQRVLRRVEDDLAAGHTHVAVQRLSTLVQMHPGDLGLRERLAAVHLMTGNLVEAGRWSYLAASPDDAAIAAFERAFPHPRARRDALRWPADERPATGSAAEARLDRLEQEVAVAAKDRRQADGTRRRATGRIAELVATTLVLVLIAVFVTGLVTALRWIL